MSTRKVTGVARWAVSLTIAAAVGGGASAQAANLLWDFGGATGNWATAANWRLVPGGANQTPVGGDVLYYTSVSNAGGFTQTNNLTAGTQIAGINFGVLPPADDTASNTSTGGFTINGNAFQLTGNITNNSSNVTGNQTFNTDINLAAGSHTLSVITGRTLAFNGDFTGAGSIFFRGLGTSVVSGNINIAGSLGKTDGGLTTINTTGNTWTATNLARGTLRLGIDNALPTTTTLTLGQGAFFPNPATFDLNGFDQQVAGLATLDGGNPGNPGTHVITNSSAVSDSTLTFAGGTSTFGTTGGTIQDGATRKVALTIGGGSLTLAAANTYSGATAINAGTLALAAGGSIADSASIDIGAGAVFDVSAKANYAMLGAQPFTFDLNPAGAGSAGLLDAAGLDISAAIVSFNALGTLDDDVYLIAMYSSLVGTQFASISGLPSGYQVNYNYLGLNQIVVMVPAPAALPAGLAILMLAAIRRRR